MRRWTVLFSVFLFLAAACDSGKEAAPTETRKDPIVGGQAESGWSAVGALTMVYPGYGYGGSFCTGTLVDPEWVLTAAHCLTAEDEGFEPMPQTTMFYVGSDANPGPGGWPASGSLYQADQFFVHPSYDEDVLGDHDIALMHLAEPVTGVTPIAINQTYMSGDWVGVDIFYVGFGVVEGLTNTGGGEKRSTFLPIYTIQEINYVSEFEGSGICFGDSGGPGLASVGGENVVIGVNANVGGSGGSGDPCKDFYFHTRVDKYVTWLSGVMGSPPPSCLQNPGFCFCDAACQPNGTCDNDACKTLSCADVYDCLVSCGDSDQGCQVDCWSAGTDPALDDLNEMFSCMADHCGNVSDAAYQQCVMDHCETELDQCLPVGTGSLSCEQVYDCMVDCGADQECSYDCYEGGTGGAQSLLDSMFACMEDHCSGMSDDDYTACVFEQCDGEIYACMPPANCDLAGGDCPPGKACYPMGDGLSDCFFSDGLGLGQDCDPNAMETLPCDDGLICISWGQSAVCEQLCEGSADCGPGEECNAPIFEGLDQLGICLCVDDDNDGVCAGVDCDDGDPDMHPGATEVCDGVDNDCNGATDEGCTAGEDTVGPDEDVVIAPQDTVGPGEDTPWVPGQDSVVGPGVDSASGVDTAGPGPGPGVTPVAPSSGCSSAADAAPFPGLLVLVLCSLAILGLRRRRRSS